jgi:hypothetical protein
MECREGAHGRVAKATVRSAPPQGLIPGTAPIHLRGLPWGKLSQNIYIWSAISFISICPELYVNTWTKESLTLGAL